MLDDLIQAISRIEGQFDADADRYLDNVAERAEREIKDLHGKQVAGQAPLKPATIAQKQRGNTPLLETGDLRQSYDTITSEKARDVGSSENKAMWMEFGTKDIPARPRVGVVAQKADKYVPETASDFLFRQLKKL